MSEVEVFDPRAEVRLRPSARRHGAGELPAPTMVDGGRLEQRLTYTVGYTERVRQPVLHHASPALRAAAANAWALLAVLGAVGGAVVVVLVVLAAGRGLGGS